MGSPEESQQRAAAEMIYGVVRGSRFWDYSSTEATWAWLLPVFQQVGERGQCWSPYRLS